MTFSEHAEAVQRYLQSTMDIYGVLAAGIANTHEVLGRFSPLHFQTLSQGILSLAPGVRAFGWSTYVRAKDKEAYINATRDLLPGVTDGPSGVIRPLVEEDTTYTAPSAAAVHASSTIAGGEREGGGIQSTLRSEGSSANTEPTATVPRMMAAVAVRQRDTRASNSTNRAETTNNSSNRGASAGYDEATPREFFVPITYEEPLEPNKAAIGVDLASEQERLEALEAARDSCNTTVTPRVILAQERGHQRGVLILAPAYRRFPSPPPPSTSSPAATSTLAANNNNTNSSSSSSAEVEAGGGEGGGSGGGGSGGGGEILRDLGTLYGAPVYGADPAALRNSSTPAMCREKDVQWRRDNIIG